jgi:hypothetical protein
MKRVTPCLHSHETPYPSDLAGEGKAFLPSPCLHLTFTPDFFVCLSDNVPLLNEQFAKTGEGNDIFLPSPAKFDG